MSEESNTQDQEKVLTPEELKERREKVIAYYTEQNEVLKLQSEFQKHKADIAENDARELMWVIRKAQMLNPPDPGKSDNKGGGQEEGPKERKLKVE